MRSVGLCRNTFFIVFITVQKKIIVLWNNSGKQGAELVNNTIKANDNLMLAPTATYLNSSGMLLFPLRRTFILS